MKLRISRILLPAMIILALVLSLLWWFRLELVSAALRSSGIENPRIHQLRLSLPANLHLEGFSGRSGSVDFAVSSGEASVSGWDFLGRDLRLKVDGAEVILPDNFPPKPQEPSPEVSPKDDHASKEIAAGFPRFSVQLEDLRFYPYPAAEPWAELSATLTGGNPQHLQVKAETILGSIHADVSRSDEFIEGQVEWSSDESPDWESIIPRLEIWGLEVPDKIVGITVEEIEAAVEWQQDSGASSRITAEGSASVFGGNASINLSADISPLDFVEAEVDLFNVEIGTINERFPFFEGQIEAQVRGNVHGRWKDGELTVLPSHLEMSPDTQGTLRFTKQGWMTGNPDLNVEDVADNLRIDQILTREDGTGILVELAARDLTVTHLRIQIFGEDSPDRKGEIELEGFSMVKGTEVPVVLTVPLRGDLQETIRILIEAALVMEGKGQ